MNCASIVVLPKVPLYDVHLGKGSGTSRVKLLRSPHCDFTSSDCHHFPVVVNASGIPWTPCTLYLLSKLKNFELPNYKTLTSIANDLLSYKRFLDEMQIAYDSFPRRKLLRPTYRYKAYLIEKISVGELRISTARRKIGRVVYFYRWLLEENIISIEHDAWRENDLSISFRGDFGFNLFKTVSSTDLHIKDQVQHHPEYIYDGGKLSPLSVTAQKELAYHLKLIGNTEMTLIFLIALTSGARLQSACTIRIEDIRDGGYDTELEAIRIGRHSLIDSKFKKSQNILLPRWLMTKLRVYSESPRARRRRAVSKHYIENKSAQYLFLTKSGKPYYISEKDPLISSYRYPPKGEAVRKFLSKTLKASSELSKELKNFRFHDLRATFGLNLVEQLSESVSHGSLSKLDILMIVKERMGHSRIETTEGYLNYKLNKKEVLKTQKAYEDYLRELIDG